MKWKIDVTQKIEQLKNTDIDLYYSLWDRYYDIHDSHHFEEISEKMAYISNIASSAIYTYQRYGKLFDKCSKNIRFKIIAQCAEEGAAECYICNDRDFSNCKYCYSIYDLIDECKNSEIGVERIRKAI